MADEKKEDEQTKLKAMQDPSSSAAAVGFKLNAHAPEFVPGSFTQMPISDCLYPFLQFLGDGGRGMGSDLIYFADQDQMCLASASHGKASSHCNNADDVIQKIVKQVEFQFSDANLIASDFLLKIMNKDPEGYVPMTVIASWKKIKALGANNQMLIEALGTSSKLVNLPKSTSPDSYILLH